MEQLVMLLLISDCRILINLPPFLWSLWCLLCICSRNWQRYLHSNDQQFFPDARECMCPIYWGPFLKNKSSRILVECTMESPNVNMFWDFPRPIKD